MFKKISIILSIIKKRNYAILRYGSATLIVLLISALNFWMGEGSPFIIMLGAVLLSTVFGRFGAGIIATVVSTIVIAYYFFLPEHNFSFAKLPPSDTAKLLVYAFEGLLISIFGLLLRRTEQLLKTERDFANTIINTTQEPLVVLNNNLKVIRANPSFYRFFKLMPKDVEGQNFYEIGNKLLNIQKLKRDLTRITRRSKYFEDLEIEKEFQDIGNKIILVTGNKINSRDKNKIMFLLSFKDITHRKELERQKDTFTAIISHELRTPITTIKGFSELLVKRLEKKEDKKTLYFIENIKSGIDNLINLIHDFLELSKIYAGKLNYHMIEFNLNELISKIIVDFKYTQSSHKIIYESAIKDAVYADRERITQVLINLISNAIKYSPKANKIIVRIKENRNKAIISVQDFGMGIAKKDQKKIFGRFYRVYPSQNQIPGTGLGLYISKEIIKRHHQRLWLKSNKNKGSIFSFSLPIYRPKVFSRLPKDKLLTTQPEHKPPFQVQGQNQIVQQQHLD